MGLVQALKAPLSTWHSKVTPGCVSENVTSTLLFCGLDVDTDGAGGGGTVVVVVDVLVVVVVDVLVVVVLGVGVVVNEHVASP